jgi:hypothetical protein
MTDDSSNQRQSRRPLPAPSAPPYHIPPPPRVPGTPPPPPKREGAGPSTAPPPPAAGPTTPTPVAAPAQPASVAPAAASLGLGLPGEATFSAELTLAEQMDDLERWAVATQGRIKFETRRVALVRSLTMAFLLGAMATISAGLVRLGTALAVLGVLGMMVDVAWPGLSSGRGLRQQAVHALRDLQNSLKIDWDRVRLMYTDPANPKRTEHALGLLDMVRTQRGVIAHRLCDIEPSPPLGRTDL